MKMKFDNYLTEKLKDIEIKEKYDRLRPEYEIITAMIKARKEKGISQSDLAKLIGTDQSRISRLEKGSLNPSLEFLKRVAEGLGQELHISFIPKHS